MSNSDSISIIIPILKLNNQYTFLYILQKLVKLKIQIAIPFSREAISKTLLRKIKNINNNINLIETQETNKLNLLKKILSQISTNYVWIVSQNFYTNYNYIIKNFDQQSDYVRPFFDLIYLTETETKYFIDNDNILLLNNNKVLHSFFDFSYIIKKKILLNAINTNSNKKYENFFTDGIIDYKKTSSIHIPAFVLNENLENNTNDLVKKKTNKNKSNDMSILNIHISYNNHPFYNEVYLNKKVINLKKNKINKPTDNFLYQYINYIVNDYNNISGYYIFSNDYFCNNPIIFNSRLKNEIKQYEGCSKDSLTFDFNWNGYVEKPTHLHKNKINFNKFVKSNLSNIKIKNLSYSKSGCFIASSLSIKKNSLDCYKRIKDNMRTWNNIEFEFFQICLGSLLN